MWLATALGLALGAETAATHQTVLFVPFAERREGVDSPAQRDVWTRALATELRAMGHTVTLAAQAPVPGALPTDWGDLRTRAQREQVDRIVHGVVVDGPGDSAIIDVLAVGPRDAAPWSGSLTVAPTEPVWTGLFASGTDGYAVFVTGTPPQAPVLAGPRPLHAAGMPKQAGLPGGPPPIAVVKPVPVAGMPSAVGLPGGPPPVPVAGMPEQAGLPPSAGLPPAAPEVERAPLLPETP